MSGGFDPGSFQGLAAVEDASFWFRARNELILWALGRHATDAQSFLEVGCGTGYVLRAVAAERSWTRVVGSELFDEGLAFARERLAGSAVELRNLDALEMPFDREFDCAGAFDVLEHIDDHLGALRGIRRAVRPGGVILITVPQHPWLWSRADDYAHHVRRYRRRDLTQLIDAAGLTLERVTSFVTIALPAMAASRVAERLRPQQAYDPLAEHSTAAALARPLRGTMTIERHLIAAGVALPVGGSLLAVARRPAWS